MGKYSLYNIPLRGLPEGKHEYKYVLDNKFFTTINDDNSDIRKGNVDVLLILKKSSATFELNFELNGTVQVPCDRCLDDVTMEVLSKNKIIVKFGAEYSEESDEIVIIPEEEGEINIAWFLYEFVALSLPMKKVHPAGMCNKAMSSKLSKHKTTSADDDGQDNDMDDVDEMDDGSDSSSSTDPRWNALKELDIED